MELSRIIAMLAGTVFDGFDDERKNRLYWNFG
jgi:hypothetical protein